MVSKKFIGFGAVGVLAIGGAVLFNNASNNVENATSPTVEGTQQAPQRTQQVNVPLYTFTDLEVTRPGGQSFTVTAVAACGELSKNFNLNNTAQLESFEQACKARTQASLDYYACDRENFIPSVPTNSADLRARGLSKPLEYVTHRHLLSPEEVASIGSRGMNAYTITQVSDIEAAASSEGFTQIANCGDVVYRGATPQAKP